MGLLAIRYALYISLFSSCSLTVHAGVADVVFAASRVRVNISNASRVEVADRERTKLTEGNTPPSEALHLSGAFLATTVETAALPSAITKFGGQASAAVDDTNTTLGSSFFGWNIPIDIPFFNGEQRSTSEPQYNETEATLFARISSSTYCQHPVLEMTDTRVINGGGMLAMVGHVGSRCVLAFRGTNNKANVVQDISSGLVLQPLPGCPDCQVGIGFLAAYQEVQVGVQQALQDLQCSNVSVTGHSLGAAVAILALYDLSKGGYAIDASYTFGQPRVGDAVFDDAWNAQLGFVKVYRFVHGLDPVVPLGPIGFGQHSHVGLEVYLGGSSVTRDHFCYLGVSMGEECGTPCD